MVFFIFFECSYFISWSTRATVRCIWQWQWNAVAAIVPCFCVVKTTVSPMTQANLEAKPAQLPRTSSCWWCSPQHCCCYSPLLVSASPLQVPAPLYDRCHWTLAPVGAAPPPCCANPALDLQECRWACLRVPVPPYAGLGVGVVIGPNVSVAVSELAIVITQIACPASPCQIQYWIQYGGLLQSGVYTSPLYATAPLGSRTFTVTAGLWNATSPVSANTSRTYTVKHVGMCAEPGSVCGSWAFERGQLGQFPNMVSKKHPW